MTREEAEVSVGSFVVDAAIRVMEMEDVLVARMACGGQICARELKMENLRSGISGTASITKSTSERESIDVVGLRRDRILSDCSWVIRSFVTSLARSLSGERSALLDGGMRAAQHTCELEALVNGGLARIYKSDWHARFLCSHQCYSQSLSSGQRMG